MRTAKPEVAEQRRSQILDAAQTAFLKYGLHEASMDDIVRTSGISKGAIYWYFDKKDQIISGAAERLFRRSLEGVRTIATARESSVENRIRELADVMSEDYRQARRWMPMIWEFYAAALRRPTVRRAIARAHREVYAILRPLVREGIKRGEFRADLDPDTVVQSWISLWEGLSLVAGIDRGLVQLGSAEAIVALLLTGVKKCPPRKAPRTGSQD